MPEKTVTRSFRINESAFLALEEEAKKRNISLNTLVNQLFMSYANFDRFFQRLGMLKMSKVAFRKILNAAPANEIVEAAKEIAQNSSRTIILARYGTLSLTGLLEYLNNYADYSSFVERSEVVSPGGKRVITLIHSYGEKGSIFVEAYSKALFELIDMEPKLSSTENSVTIEV
ncbi:MAG TPA: hypothetical protein VI278_03100 [Nitrososphaeraceae archaeon]